MSVISMKQLLEAGVHFGHQTRKWNPKMAKYIFTARNDIHVINLEQTVELVDEAYNYVKAGVQEGKTVLFVGTKKQATEAIKEEAERCGMYYVNSRWLGGTLTNFKTIRSRVERLNKLNQMEQTGEFDILPKKEVIQLKAERDKLQKNLGGIKDMTKLPGMIIVVDSKKEHICINEARALNIPIVGLIDTNCNPEEIDVVIPGNDDAIRSVKLICGALADAVIEAREGDDAVLEIKQTAKEAPVEKMEEVIESVVAPIEEEKDAVEKIAKKKVAKKPVAKVEKPAEVKAEEPVAKVEKPVMEEKAEVEAVKPARKPRAKKAEVAENTEAIKEEKPARKPRAKKVVEA